MIRNGWIVAGAAVRSAISRPSIAALVIICCLVIRSIAFGAAGDFDPSFGTNGKVATPFVDSFPGVQAIVVQPDGRLVAAGNDTDDVVLARYNSDGTPDANFGAQGVATTQLGGGPFNTTVRELVLQSDGKMVVAGGHGGMFVLIRYNSEGTLDADFGTAGVVTTEMSAGNGQVASVVLQTDGKLVAAGFAVTSSTHFALARYNTDGTLDAGFGTAGKVVMPPGGASALILQPDGKLVAAGQDPTGQLLKVVRYATDGSLDPTFGSGGVSQPLAPSPSGSARALILQPDGKLVAIVEGQGLGLENKLVRLNTDGSLDTGFGTGGVVTDAVESALVLQPDGKLVTLINNLTLRRYQPNGSVDDSFGSPGNVDGVECRDSIRSPSALAIQPDGQLVVGGLASGSESVAFGLARFQNDGGASDCGNGIVEAGETCDDGNLLQCDCCSSLCQEPPACRPTEKSVLLFRDDANDENDKLTWKWLGTATLDELAVPSVGSDYTFCLYTGPDRAALTQMQPGFGLWTAKATGYKYAAPSGFEDGITKIVLKSAVATRAKALVKGKGENLPDSLLGNLPLPVTARFVNSDTGLCMEAVFEGDDVTSNDDRLFKAKDQ